ncbi:PEP-CTERM sorting domain-containing protein [Azohydromonas caseinilytica]|uniref:Ice-binding protein C-terminal domain-containing protein n=1 Tax=Azohydromonas caseinilytica TaxID=2728836 RepID=A0A848FDT4_9BURK|nr:PEP-CTERM sorting domain-containing protein [Azohydromonas caseinilytica]NML18367.1 hypothetical protein [Azohydromonas caseinilytica]
MRRFFHGMAALVLSVGPLGMAWAADPQYRVRDLSALTGLSDATVFSMNNRGDVALYDHDSGHGFLWRDGTLHDLGTAVSGLALNDRGAVAGTRRGADGSARAFLWRDGRFTDLNDALGAGSAEANGINASGQITGTADGRAYVWDGRRVRYLDLPGATGSTGADISDRGVVGGAFERANDGLDARAFVARDGRVEVLPEPIVFEFGGRYEALAVNDKGSAVVRYWDYNWGDIGSSLYLDGRLIDLGVNRLAMDINARDWAVGTNFWEVNEDEFVRTAMLYRADGSRDLNGLLVAASAARWDLQIANAINDRGQIAGYGVLGDGSERIFLATPVPEASGIAMLLAGLGVVGAAARVRRRTAGGTAAP